MESITETNLILDGLGYKQSAEGIPKTVEALDEFKQRVEEITIFKMKRKNDALVENSEINGDKLK